MELGSGTVRLSDGSQLFIGDNDSDVFGQWKNGDSFDRSLAEGGAAVGGTYELRARVPAYQEQTQTDEATGAATTQMVLDHYEEDVYTVTLLGVFRR